MAILRLKFFEGSDGTGKLVARAEAHGFAGKGGAYFTQHQLEEFAAELRSFPLVGRPSIAGGFYVKGGSGQLEQELLALECYAIDRQGHLGIQVRMATELWPNLRPDSRHATTLEIVTTYESLGRFSRTLLALVRGVLDEAILEGE